MSQNEHSKIGRRTFLGGGVAGVAPATMAVAAAQPAGKVIRIGVVGLGPRGQWLLRNLLTHHADVAVPAVCDLHEDRVNAAAALIRKHRDAPPSTYSRGEYDYRRMCERDDLDAVLVATPVNWLARITIDAARAGKHAAFEVSGIQTEDECWEMVRTKQQTGKHIMFLENCCYGDDNLMIYRMIKQGVFGEPYYAEGSYVHDCRSYFFDAAGKITWRGELQRDVRGSAYPQHGLGSNCKWLEINDGDRLESCQTMMTSPRESHLWAAGKFGPGSPQAQIRFQEGDFITSLISTAKGRMIRLDYSISCTRPYSRYYLLQGTKGCWDSRSGIFLAEESPGKSGGETWESMARYRPKYQHSYWRETGSAAQRSGGHGGIDYFTIADFVRMLREDNEPWIDVYDAATWSSIIFCSKLSLDRNGARVPIPDFTGGRWKDPNWRKDRIPSA